MKQKKPSLKQKNNSLSALSIPESYNSPSPYPWPLIMWPIEHEAIAKLKELRREWQKEDPGLHMILRKRLERRGVKRRKYPIDSETALALYLPKKTRGRPKGSSPLQTDQSLMIAILTRYYNVKPAEILSALGRDSSSGNTASFGWLRRRRLQGEKLLDSWSPQERAVISGYPRRKIIPVFLKDILAFPD